MAIALTFCSFCTYYTFTLILQITFSSCTLVPVIENDLHLYFFLYFPIALRIRIKSTSQMMRLIDPSLKNEIEGLLVWHQFCYLILRQLFWNSMQKKSLVCLDWGRSLFRKIQKLLRNQIYFSYISYGIFCRNRICHILVLVKFLITFAA